MFQVMVSVEKINLAYIRFMGSIEHGNVFLLLISVPWVRLNDVKAVVHDDHADPVILGLGTVVLVAFASVVVQVSSVCLTNKIHLAPRLLHSCGLQLFEPPDQLPQVWNQGRVPVQCAVPPLYIDTEQLVCGCSAIMLPVTH